MIEWRGKRKLKFECLICPGTCFVLSETVGCILLPQKCARPCYYLHFTVQKPEVDLSSDVQEVVEPGFESGRGLIAVSGDFLLPRGWCEWVMMGSGIRQRKEHAPGQQMDLGLNSNLPFNQLPASFTISRNLRYPFFKMWLITLPISGDCWEN